MCIRDREITGKKFGDKENPLLVSVRSGARASMPGMMDTILNLGMNDQGDCFIKCSFFQVGRSWEMVHLC